MRRRRLDAPRADVVDDSCAMTRASMRERERWRRKVRAQAKKATLGGAGHSLLLDEHGHYLCPPSLDYMLLRGGGEDPSIEVFNAELEAEASAAKAAVAHARAAIDEATHAASAQRSVGATTRAISDDAADGVDADGAYWSYWADMDAAKHGLLQPERPQQTLGQLEEPKQLDEIEEPSYGMGFPSGEAPARWVPSRPPSRLHALMRRPSAKGVETDTRLLRVRPLMGIPPHPLTHAPAPTMTQVMTHAQRRGRGEQQAEARAQRAARAAVGGGHATRMDLRTSVIDRREATDDSRYAEAVRKSAVQVLMHARDAARHCRAR